MRKFTFYLAHFVLAVIARGPACGIARADHVGSAHLQVRDGLGRSVESSSGDAEDVAALLEFARDPQAFVPNQLATKQPIDPTETLDKRKVAENLGKKIHVEALRVYKNKTILVPDEGIVWIPMATFHKETIQVEGGLEDSAKQSD